ncbi:MAG TPA: hypothetical protein VG367_19520 [Mucilaginibacter sp.]|jgi:hypothetical protein|nr:hypothetical protein [Mucilaginibacter sp.]
MRVENLQGALIKFILLIIASIIVGVFIPGFIHYNIHDFDKHDVFVHLDKEKQGVILRNQSLKNRITIRKKELISLLLDTSKKITPEQILTTDQAIKSLDEIEKQSLDKSVVITDFYPDNNVLLLWPLLYFGLSTIIFFIVPRFEHKTSIKSVLSVFLIFALLMRWPTWMRNLPIGTIGRFNFNTANFDISKTGFFLQEVQALISIFLLSIIICRWVSYARNLRKTLLAHFNYTEAHALKMMRYIRIIYIEWQFSSLFLAIAFGFYSYYFWDLISNIKDYRFVPHAIIIHMVWAIAWIIISMPLIIMKNYRASFKEHFLALEANTPDSKEFEKIAINSVINEDPISAQNKTITALISVITFALPIIKGFF